MYNIIQSGSKGNAVIYGKEVLVDCGVAFSKLQPFLSDVKLILLTHSHKDHLQKNTVIRIAIQYPKIKWIVPIWLQPKLTQWGVKNLHTVDINTVFTQGFTSVSPFKVYHNIDNCGWRIVIGTYFIFHATDTTTLDGITAKNYDLYGLEFNYDENTIDEIIDEKKAKEQYSYEEKAIKRHMSWQESRKFFEDNRGNHSQLIKLHVSSRYSNEQISKA